MRETGVVRKELSDEEAVPHIGFARTVLGQLKNQMGLGGLQQGSMTRRLPDGTVVKVQSVFGQDKISIEKPIVAEESVAAPVEISASEQEVQISAEPLVLEQEYPNTTPYLWVGLRWLSGGTFLPDTTKDELGVVFHLYVWEPEQASPRPGKESMILSARGASFDHQPPAVYPLQQTKFITVPTPAGPPAPPGSTFRLNYTNNGMYLVNQELAYDPVHPNQQWDQVVVLDPAEGKRGVLDPITQEPVVPLMPPPDQRGLWTLPGHTQPGITGTVLGGHYEIGLNIEGDLCSLLPPATILLEVRCGRPALIQHYQITITEFTQFPREIFPYGWFGGFGGEDGPCPHATGWWKQTIRVNPYGGQQVVADLPRGFAPLSGEPNRSRELLCSTDEFVQSDIVFEGGLDCAQPANTCAAITDRLHYFIEPKAPSRFTSPSGVLPSAANINASWATSGNFYSVPGGIDNPGAYPSTVVVHGGTITCANGNSLTQGPQSSQDGFKEIVVGGVVPRVGTFAVCNIDPTIFQQAGVENDILHFHWWWDRDGFHTAPGWV